MAVFIPTSALTLVQAIIICLTPGIALQKTSCFHFCLITVVSRNINFLLKTFSDFLSYLKYLASQGLPNLLPAFLP